jgi:putative transposase
MRYAFIKDHRAEYRVTLMCRVLRVHRSGFYAWLKKPKSDRALEDERLLVRIRYFWNESGQTYGSPRIYRDLLETEETCGLNRVAKIMRRNGIRVQIGYRKRRYRYGKPAVTAANHLQQNFVVEDLDRAWVTDISYVSTKEGWLYIAVVMDLCSRKVIGWSMRESLHRELVIQALLMAVWNRRPDSVVLIHSDQGSQFGSDDWIRFCKEHGLKRSMSRRGNCYDNAAMESFFGSLKKERVRRKCYRTRVEARSDLFEYIEVFYNRKRRHEHLDYQSPADFERMFNAS